MKFGIDFGTTNSACVGVEEGGKAYRFTDSRDDPFPSIVIVDRKTGSVYCGREAWRKRERLRGSCEVIASVKTLLNSEAGWSVAGKRWTPEDVASIIFGALKDIVKKRLGEDALNEAVVAVPVGFSTGRRASLRRAARKAGVEIKSFISEPTAALFSEYGELRHYTRIGVFDWGGGTLDVCVVENREGRIKEISTGRMDMAGDYIDRLMADWIHKRLMKKENLRVPFAEMPPEARDILITSCEQAKKDLSFDDTAVIQFVDYGEIEYVQEVIDFESFSELVDPVVDEAIRCFESCVRQSGISIKQLDCILMVGGSVNLRPLREKIETAWGESVLFFPRDPDWSVATGAASLSINPGKYLLAQTIGIIMSDGTLYPLMEKGKPVEENKPVHAYFALTENDQDANLVFGDERGRVLGYLNVPAIGFFREKIEVSAFIDSDHILKVYARSHNRSEKTKRIWSYSDVHLDYQLPVTDLEVVTDE